MTKKLLIISPGFHGYYSAIRLAFESLGYDVETHCYDATSSMSEKLWNKARYELVGRLSGNDAIFSRDKASERAIEVIREVKPDAILVIRGDILTQAFWEAATSVSSHVSMWMYDEMRRTDFDAALLGPDVNVASYSRLDVDQLRANGIDAQYVPLGFDHFAAVGECPPQAQNAISFVGAPLPKRREALETLIEHGIPVHAWGRGWSDHPVDRARTWRMSSSGVPNSRDIPSSTSLAVMEGSLVTLNIHGDQDGFTMRTFEAAGVGAIELVDREDVREFYTPGEHLLVFNSTDELVEISRHVMRAPADFQQLREEARAHTLAHHTLAHRAKDLETRWL